MRVEQAHGSVLRQQGREVTPVARVVRIAWRGRQVEWHRPLAVELREGGAVVRIPIHNATRRAVVSLLLSGCALGTLAWWAERIQHQGREV
ncbi:MAG TPA: hypothetical protein VIG30_00495 [Ktedonobacterales bacterium]|jgi:hypothetical protein